MGAGRGQRRRAWRAAQLRSPSLSRGLGLGLGRPQSRPQQQQQQQSREREQSPKLHLDLYNFDSPDAEGSRYVLTSPRSLEACARCGVKPVELLPRPLADFAHEAPGRSMRVATGLFEVAPTSLTPAASNTSIPATVTSTTARSVNGLSTSLFAHTNGYPASQPKKRGKSHSLESLQRRREPTCSSTTTTTTTTRTSSESGASSYSWEGSRDQERWAKASSPRARTVATFNSLMGRSLSLGDLSHSPQTTQKVERIVKEVKRRGLKAVSERDRKIAALMLAKHQEEDIMSQTRYVAHLQWDSERRLEELRREREDREKQRAVQHCQRAWHSQVSSRQQRLTQQEREAAAAKLRQAAESEERWRELAEQQERSRQERLRQAAREERQKKLLQEQNLRALEEERVAVLEQEQLLLREKLSMAELKKQEREHQAQEERRGLNRAEKRRHAALLREIARREAEEREAARRAIEEKLSRSSEKYEQIVERRGQELREKAKRHPGGGGADAKEKALRAVQSRQEKEKLQRLNRQRVEEEEHQRRMELLQSIERKLEKSEQIFREKRAVLESARSVARASFHVRDRVREETNMRTFDKMALEAQLKASLDENLADWLAQCATVLGKGENFCLCTRHPLQSTPLFHRYGSTGKVLSDSNLA
ncbi:hypothetical protein MATL_G00161470 [Megalops atlanticus]|uniref:Coiled-coil domain-containing protein 177 n=1 Tax=Megalops atlanticus TaxID=7932 RepID=A0A9D3T932_MEGAT|nr:hypothetical protein MATL_G00161470 [Megalops atlanticus]